VEKYYIYALENGGLTFGRIEECKIDAFKNRWKENRIYFIVEHKKFMRALGYLI